MYCYNLSDPIFLFWGLYSQLCSSTQLCTSAKQPIYMQLCADSSMYSCVPVRTTIYVYIYVNLITLIYLCTSTYPLNIAVYRCREHQCPFDVSVHVQLQFIRPYLFFLKALLLAVYRCRPPRYSSEPHNILIYLRPRYGWVPVQSTPWPLNVSGHM